ncbi:MAG: site-specific DNA-methyltransferase [Deltaproteobacteria bacterium]|nr:site-specific DNA-methyltransferase [Deltaproteobacteria bacterium]
MICTEIIGKKSYLAQIPVSELGGSYFCGDNLKTMELLLEDYSASFDCIYLDPPFFSKRDYSAQLNSSRLEAMMVFTDKWQEGFSSYAQAMKERLKIAYLLLKNSGSLFLHCDYRTTAFFRLTLDEIFGQENYVNEIIWQYKTGGVPEKLGFGKKHDTIHYYVKDRNKAQFFRQKEKSYLRHKYGFSNIQVQQDEHGPYTMVNCRDVFDIPALRGNQPERISYPTQKPEALLERLILATTEEGGLVGDFFAGSGTTGVVAAKNKRRWFLADQSDYALHVFRKRLLHWQTGMPSSPYLVGRVYNQKINSAPNLSSLIELQALTSAESKAIYTPLKSWEKLGLGDLCPDVDLIAIENQPSVKEPFCAQWLEAPEKIKEQIFKNMPEQTNCRIRLINVQGQVVEGSSII